MAIVDEKGRLFGKVNLLDLAVVLAVVAVAGRFGYQAVNNVAPVGEDKTIEMTFKLPAVSKFTIDVLQPGAGLYDSKSNAYMGKVVEVKEQPAIVVSDGNDGRLHERESKTVFDYFVTIAGPARVSPNGVTMGGIEVKVGRTNGFKTAYWAGQGTPVVINTQPAQR